MYKDLVEKRTKLAVIGLGYVGLPVALAFARKLSVIGFDIKRVSIRQMQNAVDPSKNWTPLLLRIATSLSQRPSKY